MKELPPSTTVVIANTVKAFNYVISSIINSCESEPRVKRINGVDVQVNNIRYIMASSARSVRGLSNYGLMYAHDAEAVRDYEYIKDHHKRAVLTRRPSLI